MRPDFSFDDGNRFPSKAVSALRFATALQNASVSESTFRISGGYGLRVGKAKADTASKRTSDLDRRLSAKTPSRCGPAKGAPMLVSIGIFCRFVGSDLSSGPRRVNR
jgi:hypothetical protein